jgi:hypothetical protein
VASSALLLPAAAAGPEGCCGAFDFDQAGPLAAAAVAGRWATSAACPETAGGPCFTRCPSVEGSYLATQGHHKEHESGEVGDVGVAAGGVFGLQ